MIFQEGLVESVEFIVDPMNLIFWTIATALFVINSYKRGEIRLFSASFAAMIFATLFCYLEFEAIEATLIVIASSLALLSAIYLRIKTMKTEVL